MAINNFQRWREIVTRVFLLVAVYSKYHFIGLRIFLILDSDLKVRFPKIVLDLLIGLWFALILFAVLMCFYKIIVNKIGGLETY